MFENEWVSVYFMINGMHINNVVMDQSFFKLPLGIIFLLMEYEKILPDFIFDPCKNAHIVF